MREHDADLAIIDWLSDGPRIAPDRVVQHTFAYVRSHPAQDRFNWRSPMAAATLRRPAAPTLRFALIVATVALVSAMLGVYIGSHQRAVIPPLPTPTAPTPTAPMSTPKPTPVGTYPVVSTMPDTGLAWMSRAVSGNELWTMGTEGLWHFVNNAWQLPADPYRLDGETLTGVALGPDGALWVTSETYVAIVGEGDWRVVWKVKSTDPLRGLAVASDGTAWVGQGNELIKLRPVATGYAAQYVSCPYVMSRFAVTTDGTVYGGSFGYSDGPGGFVKSDGTSCTEVDVLGDGQVHEIADLSAGPDGRLLATVFDEPGGACCHVALALLQDDRWSTISGPTVVDGISFMQAMDPSGRPWRIDDSGLQLYDSGAWRLVDATPGWTMAMAPEGVLWYQTERGIERIQTTDFGE